MQNLFRLMLGLALTAPAFAQINAGVLEVAGDNKSIPVTIRSSDSGLQALALTAFGAHGRYKPVASNGAYAFSFAPAGGSAVTVTITKGSAGTPVHTETVTGTSLRNALLKAADVAVAKTSGGLKGFFAGKLAFVADRGGQQTLMTSDLFFTEVQSHPVNGKQIVGPRWSPDGSRIIFTSYRTGFPDIYILDLRSRKLETLASFKGTNSGGRFSPDGSRIAMVLSGEGNPEIYVGNAQGRQIKRLTNNQSVEASPAWSPDGSRLVFTSDAPGKPQLHVMSATGGAMTRLVTSVSNYCAEPDWSAADPKKIAFTAGVGRGFQIAVYDFGAGKGQIVSKAPMDAVEPVWTADGRHVICTFRSASSRALYLLDTETGRATRLSPTAAGDVGNAAYLPTR